MFNAYRSILTIPGAVGFSSAGLLARLPISMLGIGIVLLMERMTGSYTVAGAVAATFGLVQAVCSPLVARLVDRFGQARVMFPAIAAHVGGLAVLLVTARGQWPLWSTFVAAAVAGSSIGSIGALARARWSFVLQDRPDRTRALHTAYALESVLDEVVFISGPLIVTMLAVYVSPLLGIVTAMAAVSIGGTAFLLQRRTEPPADRARPPRGTGVLRSPGVVVLVVSFVFIGVVFGSIEVVTVAFTQDRGVPAAAGWVLAAFAGGSLLAGVAYGAVHWLAPAGRRYVLSTCLVAVSLVPVVVVESVPWLVLVGFVAGFAISPTIISGTALVQDLVVPSRLTEGLTWISTAIGLGVAAGSAGSGVAVDAVGAHRSFLVTLGAGVLAAVIVLLFSRWLRSTST